MARLTLLLRRALVIALVLLLSAISSNRAQASAVSEVLAAWQARQDAVESFTVRWSAEIGKPTSASSWGIFNITGEVVVDPSGRILVDGSHVGDGWDIEAELKARRSIHLFDGASQVTFWPKNDKGFPSAFIKEGSTRAVTQDLRLLPVFLAFRPLDERFRSFAPESLTDTGNVAEFRGEPCHVFETGSHSLWITTDPRHLPMRYVRRSDDNGVLLTETQVTYTQHGTMWVPETSFTLRFGFDETDVLETRDARYTHFSMNESIPTSRFHVDFPPGTWVHNLITDESYILRAGRPNRPVLRGEYTGNNYEQLKNSDPPQPPSKNGRWLVWANVALLTLVALGITTRSLLKRRKLDP